jgi:two-component system cell cycle response regulator DivK
MTRTVLIVEDNVLNQKYFNDLLQANGYQTLTADDGEEALAVLGRERPDLVLLDLRLPGISGFEVAARLKGDQALRTIPVLMVSALALRPEEADLDRMGCDGYLKKPVAAETLLTTVERMAV